jgi:fibronectin-binding autotransporter adhesin
MRKFTGRQPHSLPFGLLLVVVGALLLPSAIAPRANAGSTDYWDFENPLGSRPRSVPELFAQPQGMLINQPLASNYNPTLALNVASGGQPGAFQPLQVDANISWSGVFNSDWSNSANWSSGGPPGPGDTAVFNQAFLSQPNLTTGVTIGTIWMTDGVTRNVTISSNGGTLSLSALGMLGTGILIDNTNAFTLTITANVSIGRDEAWINNSGNLFTVSGNIALGGNGLTVNGTGDTLISGVIAGVANGSILAKDGTGTLTLTGNDTFTRGTTVNGGTLLVNNTAASGVVTVNNTGSTLGGIGTISGAVTVNAGSNIAPGNGGNNTGILTTGALTLAATSNFRLDINGTAAGTGYDQLNVAAGELRLPEATLWSQSARHCRSGRHLPF